MKAKRMDTKPRHYILPVVFFVLIVGVVLLGDYHRSMDRPNQCLPRHDISLITYGFEGQRTATTTNDIIINTVADLSFYPFRGDVTDYAPHTDVALYARNQMIGTLWFRATPDMQNWLVQINDGQRRDCGLYAVALDDVTALFALIGTP
jgi:hypothetical protein